MKGRIHSRKVGVFLLAAAMTTGCLAPLSAQAAGHDGSTMYMVGNAHIDTAWEWAYEETARDVLRETFGKEVELLNDNPNYKFTASVSKHYEWTKEYYPEMYEDIKKLIANGQWDNPGGQVVEPDINIPSGESLVRQHLEGQHFFINEFNKPSTVGYVPDTFGFSGQFPQILQKSGMTSFVTTKLNWQDTNRDRDSDVFKWKGIDGSEVLSYACMYDYPSGNYNDDEVKTALDRNKQEGKDSGVRKALGMFGGGDHGGGPNPDQYDPNLSRTVDGAQVKLATISEFFDDLAKDDLSQVRTVDGEMYFEYHRGTYTSWAQVKKYNRKNEILAEKAEKAATLGNWLNVLPDADADNIWKAWDKILINQFHDVLPGSSIPYVYMDTYNDQEMAENLLEDALRSGVQAMAYMADTDVGGTPVIVFNALSWARSEMVELTVSFPGEVPGNVTAYDGETALPTTISSVDSDNKTAVVRFLAEDLPAVGYKVFALKAEENAVATDLSATQDADQIVLENDSLKVEISKATGNITQVYDKKDGGRAAFAAGTGSELHILRDTGGSAYPAWDVIKSEMEAAPIGVLNGDYLNSVRILEESPERVVVRVEKSWSNSTIRQDIILDAGSDQVAVDMNVNWKEDQQMLKISFPMAADADMASYEMAYGSLQRPTTRDNKIDGAKFEVSGHKWADITDNSGSHGVSILNDCKYGWDALKVDGATRLRLTALRSPSSAQNRTGEWTPDRYYIDKTQHTFSYAIYPHAGTWQDADTVRGGYEFNYPSEVEQATVHAGSLGQSHSFASAVSADNNVPLTVIKTPTDNPDAKDELILRVYESEGKDNSSVTITLPANVLSAKEVNLLEHGDANLNKQITVSGKTLTFTLDKYEITTVAVTLEDSGFEAVELLTAPVDLSDFYNMDGVSYNENRRDGSYDGAGNSIPAELWEEKDYVEYRGVPFTLGSPADGENNIVRAEGQRIRLPKGKYDVVYLLGASAGVGDASGVFTVYQTGGESVQQEIAFAAWDANLSGWNRFTNQISTAPVDDQIGTFFTHFHNGTADRMTVDNYQYVYAIPVDPGKDLESIELPDAPGIKIMAVTAAKSDFIETSFQAGVSAAAPEAVTNAAAAVDVQASNDDETVVNLTWTNSAGVDHVRIHRDISPEFVADAGNCVGATLAGETSYKDVLKSQGLYFYRVVGVSADGVEAPASEVLGPIVYQGMQNAALSVAHDKVTASHNFNNEEPYKAVDGNEGTKWCGKDNDNQNKPVWLKVDLGEDNTWSVSKFAVISTESDGYVPRDFKIQGSDDDAVWTDLVTVTDNTNMRYSAPLQEAVSYRYYRLWLTKAEQNLNGSNTARIFEFRILGQNDEIKLPTVSDLTLSAEKSADDTEHVTFTADYRFKIANPDDSDHNTKIEWFKTVGGVQTKLDGETARELVLTEAEALSYQKLSVKVTPYTAAAQPGEALEKKLVFNSGDAVDDLGNLVDSVLQGKPVTDSVRTGAGEAGSKMVDGDFGSKWCGLHITEENPGVAVIDLQGKWELDKIELFHATYAADNNVPGADGRDKNQDYNTRKYNLSISDDGETWTPLAAYDKDDGSSKTSHVFDTAAVGCYLKLEVTQPVKDVKADGNLALRVNEMMVGGRLLAFPTAGANEQETPQSVVRVSIEPSRGVVAKGSTQQFNAVAEGVKNPPQTVTWSVEGGAAGTGIDADGLLTVAADETAASVKVKAISTFDTSKFDEIDVGIGVAMPSITTQPADRTVDAGETASFTVAADAPDAGALSYQWEKKPAERRAVWTAIDGAESAGYTTPVTTLADSGAQYRCVVTNAENAGQQAVKVYSEPATLTVELRYAVTLDAGETGTVEPEEITVTYGRTYGEAEGLTEGALPVPTNTNEALAFDGWFLNETKVTANTKVTAVETHTLTALWRTIEDSASPDAEVSGMPEKVILPYEGDDITLAVKEADTYAYQWQFKNAADKDWTDMEEDGAAYVIAAESITIEMDGMQYRCVVTNSEVGKMPVTAASPDVTLHVEERAVERVTIDPTAKTLTVGDTFQLTATVEPEDAVHRTVTWTSDEPEIAAVDENGLITAVAEGTAVVTAEADGVTATCTIRVEEPYVPSYTPPSNTTTKTEKNGDGSTTKTVTNKKTGDVTATTTYPDGTKIVATTPKDGETGIEVTVPKDKETVIVTIPTAAEPKPGEVAVVVKEDGSKEILKTSIATENGMRVLLSESCKLEIMDNSKSFADVPADHWAADAVQFVASRELFTGGDSGFLPAGEMSRAMLFTVLARLDGQDTTGGETWYSASMDWARESGISDGSNAEGNITRESLAVMLYRYAGSPAVDAARRDEVIAPYTDAASVSDWAADAMLWAADSGIITGSDGKLNPNGTATRAEVAMMLERFIGKMM